ncbi:MAG: hypothetical protein ACRYGP_17410 [Janthinobacterium lividum]
MGCSRALFLCVPLVVFAVTQGAYRIYLPHLPTALAYWHAPGGPSGPYYSPFLSNQTELNDQNFSFFWICIGLNATFCILWVSAGLWVTFRRWSETIKRRRLQQGDDQLLAQMFAAIALCLWFLFGNIPGRVHGVYEAVMVENLYMYVYIYAIFVYLTVGIAAFIVVYGFALRAFRRERLGLMR